MLRIMYTEELGQEEEHEPSILEAVPHIFADLPSSPGILLFPSEEIMVNRAEDGMISLVPEDEMKLVRAFKRLMGDDSGEGCMLIPPGEDPLESFSSPVTGDKTSFMRELKNILSMFCQPPDAEWGCPMLIVRIGDFSATGTMEKKKDKIVIKASDSWFTSKEPDTYILSMEDGVLEAVTHGGGREKAILEHVNIQDILSFVKKMEKNHAGDFVFSWYLPEDGGKQPLVIASSISKQSISDTSGNISHETEVVDEELPAATEETVKNRENEKAHSVSPTKKSFLGLQPTAIRVVSMGKRPPEMPDWIGQWNTDASQLQPSKSIDHYIFLAGEVSEETKQKLTAQKHGRLFIIISPENIPHARKTLANSFSTDKILFLAHVDSSSDAFMAEEIAKEADGAYIDDMMDMKGSARLMSRTIETVSKSMGPEKIILANATSYFWSEEFLVETVENCIYALTVSVENVPAAVALLAGTERRLLLKILMKERF